MTQNAPEITPLSTELARPTEVSIAGHFGELVQGRLGPDGPVALVTLHRNSLVTKVSYAPATGPLMIETVPNEKIRRIAKWMLEEAGRADMGGVLKLERTADPGNGVGSSTADLLGTLRVIGSAIGRKLPPEEEAALCLEVEGAVDPLMFETPVVFASREGRVIDRLGPMPDMRVVGIFAGPPQRTDPDDCDFPDVSSLITELSDAVAADDLDRLGEIATRSAELNQVRNPNPAWLEMRSIAQSTGAAGVVVAHTGPAIGVLISQSCQVETIVEEVSSLGFGSARIL